MQGQLDAWLVVYSRKSTKVGVSGESGGVELNVVVEDGDGGRGGAVPVRLVVALVEDQAHRLCLLPVAQQEQRGEEEGGHGVQEWGAVVQHHLEGEEA